MAFALESSKNMEKIMFFIMCGQFGMDPGYLYKAKIGIFVNWDGDVKMTERWSMVLWLGELPERCQSTRNNQ